MSALRRQFSSSRFVADTTFQLSSVSDYQIMWMVPCVSPAHYNKSSAAPGPGSLKYMTNCEIVWQKLPCPASHTYMRTLPKSPNVVQEATTPVQDLDSDAAEPGCRHPSDLNEHATSIVWQFFSIFSASTLGHVISWGLSAMVGDVASHWLISLLLWLFPVAAMLLPFATLFHFSFPITIHCYFPRIAGTLCNSLSTSDQLPATISAAPSAAMITSTFMGHMTAL
jgi:hypothetical protein